MAYWKINYNYNLDLNEPKLIELLTSIKCYCDIIKDIPVGYGLKNEFITEKFSAGKFSGTLKDEIILKDIHGTTAIFILGGNTNDKKRSELYYIWGYK